MQRIIGSEYAGCSRVVPVIAVSHSQYRMRNDGAIYRLSQNLESSSENQRNPHVWTGEHGGSLGTAHHLPARLRMPAYALDTIACRTVVATNSNLL